MYYFKKIWLENCPSQFKPAVYRRYVDFYIFYLISFKVQGTCLKYVTYIDFHANSCAVSFLQTFIVIYKKEINILLSPLREAKLKKLFISSQNNWCVGKQWKLMLIEYFLRVIEWVFLESHGTLCSVVLLSIVILWQCYLCNM